MIQINDAYFWQPEDADVVGKWVNFLFFDFRTEDQTSLRRTGYLSTCIADFFTRLLSLRWRVLSV